MTTNWEILTFVERMKVNLLEKMIEAATSRKIALKLELEVYQVYKKALQRRHSLEVSKRG